MVVAVFDRKNTILTIRGHAGSAPKGEDLVCAAASALAFTAAAFAEANGERYMPTVLAQDGEIRIACRPAKNRAPACRQMLDVIFTGFEILEKTYPDNVRTERED